MEIPISVCALNSPIEPFAITRNLALSGFVVLSRPSAILLGTESAERVI
jgi:hypothetical protein